MGGRLHHFWENWVTIGADDWVLSVLRKGYYLPLESHVPLTSSPPPMGYNPFHPLFQELREQLQILITKDAVEEVHDHSPGFYSRLFLAPKKGGEWRPVIDLSTLNRFMVSPHFKMETPTSILQATQPGQWATSLDLKDAFFHIMIAKPHRKFLRFLVDGRHYQFRALPFGLTMSPYVFTRVMKAVGAYARTLGLKLYLYLDDWILLSASAQIAKAWMDWLLALARALGLVVNIPKCDLTPSQIYHFIGILFNLILGTAQPTPARVDAFLELAEMFLLSHHQPAGRWQQLLGHMTSLKKLVPRGRLYMRPVQFCLQEQWNQLTQPQSHRVYISQEARTSIRWWSHRHNLERGTSLLTSAPDVQLFTDASTTGWGAHIALQQVSGTWTASSQAHHINFLELKAVLLALQHFHQSVRGHHVIVMSDNMTVVGLVKNQGGTHSRELFTLTAELFQWADSHQVILSARHIPGHLNVIADRLSRSHQILPGEWSLCPHVTQRLWKVWGRPHLDLFATADNAKLPTYVSPLPDPAAWAIDALSFSWTQMWAYAYPPIPLLHQILQKMSQEPCDLILVAPAWPTQSWFPLLLQMSIDHPRELPPTRHLLKQTGRNVFHDDPQRLHLHAWRLSSRQWSIRASPKAWLGASPTLTGAAPRSSTTAGGMSSVGGARRDVGDSILSLQLSL